MIGSYDGFLYALDAATGKLRWKLETDGPVHATPAVHERHRLSRGLRRELPRRQRSPTARSSSRSPPAPTPARRRSSTATAPTSARSTTKCSRSTSRRKKIALALREPERQFPFYSSAALAGGRVIVGGRDKLVHAIDAATGKAAWTFTTRARVDSSPAVAGGRVYVGSSDGRLYVLDAAHGPEAVGVRGRRRAHRLARDRRGPGRHRLRRRRACTVSDSADILRMATVHTDARAIVMGWVVVRGGSRAVVGRVRRRCCTRARRSSGNPLKALLCVGVAYFLVGVIVPVATLSAQGKLSGFNAAGLGPRPSPARSARSAPPASSGRSATGGMPLYVMPLVFGGAPIVNVLYSMMVHPPKTAPNPMLYLGFLLASIGAGMVLYFRPQS